jgi:hypothetical protein
MAPVNTVKNLQALQQAKNVLTSCATINFSRRKLFYRISKLEVTAVWCRPLSDSTAVTVDFPVSNIDELC